MKVKILSSAMKTFWYSDRIGDEFYVDYNIESVGNPFIYTKNHHYIRSCDSVITELPKSFCVKRCDDKDKWGKYIQWLNKTYNSDFGGVWDYYGLSNKRGNWYYDKPFGTEIHIDDMIKHIDYMERHIKGGGQFSKESQLIVKMDKIIKEETNMNTQKLSRQGLKEIHSVACSAWKETLVDWAKNRNIFKEYIELSQEEVNNIFDAFTKEQLPIISKYLKKEDDGSVDLSKIACEVYLDSQLAMIEIRNRYEYCDKAFWLNDVYFNWEIKKDSIGKLCLIPTKKK